MTNFKKLFTKTSVYPKEILYKEKKVVLSDKFFVNNGEIIILNIEKTSSQFLQGIRLRIAGKCQFFGKILKKGKFINLLLWEQSDWYDLKNAELKIYTKEPFIHVSNAWKVVNDEKDNPACWAGGDEWFKHDHWGGAGMIVEEIENGRRYYCNDGECDDDFNDIIFTVTKKMDLDDSKK